MSTPLHVLIVEDGAEATERMVRELERAGFRPTWQAAGDPAGYLWALAEQPQVIIARSTTHRLGARQALDLLHEQGYEIPLIVISSVADEDTGIECLRHGATDHLYEDRLARLGPAIERALRQRRMLAERRRAERTARVHERRFRAAFDNAPVGMALTTAHGYIIDANAALCALTRCTVEQIRAGGLSELVAPQDRDQLSTAAPQPARTAAPTVPPQRRPANGDAIPRGAAGGDAGPRSDAERDAGLFGAAEGGIDSRKGVDGDAGLCGAADGDAGTAGRRLPEIRLLRAGTDPLPVRYCATVVDDALETGGSGTGWHVIHQFSGTY